MAKRNDEQEIVNKKIYVIPIIVVLVIFLIYGGRLFQWQIVQGASFRKEAEQQNIANVMLDGARGEILDSEGQVLAGNKISYGIKFNVNTMDQTDRNPTLARLLKILKDHNEPWLDELPILLDEEGTYIFDAEREKEVAYLKSDQYLDLQPYATADDCISALMNKHNVIGYSKEMTRDILSLRYTMFKISFGYEAQYSRIADNISADTVGIINQDIQNLPGVETDVVVTRYQGEDGSIAPHVVGTLGAIDEEQLAEITEAGELFDVNDNVTGYMTDATVGKSGIEAAFEEKLRGLNGKQNIAKKDGNVESTSMEQAPSAGNTIQLTLDSKLQKVANQSLEENVNNNRKSARAKTGAVVALDMTGGVLVSATYPSFDLIEYYEDDAYLQSLMENEDQPQFNRATNGLYTVGSVFKPLVAVAALQEGVINTSTSYGCGGQFDKYASDHIGCLAHKGLSGTGIIDYMDVYSALQESCNTFFCETGVALQINRMGVYAEYFGLGTKTGVEINESTGLMSNMEAYKEAHGMDWTAGNTAAASIGQLDSVFTPIQLATYCGTIANGGKRYETHFLDKIFNYNRDEIIEEYEPKVVMDAQIDPYVMEAVHQGMQRAATSGTAEAVFGDYPINVCAKTGTAETDKKESNITFIAFAPAEAPEIAVAVVMEYGDSGAYAMNVARDIFDAYFGYEVDEETGERVGPEDEGTSSNVSEESSDIPENGEEWDIGAFYDPERDRPTPKPSSSSMNSNSENSGDGDDPEDSGGYWEDD